MVNRVADRGGTPAGDETVAGGVVSPTDDNSAVLARRRVLKHVREKYLGRFPMVAFGYDGSIAPKSPDKIKQVERVVSRAKVPRSVTGSR